MQHKSPLQLIELTIQIGGLFCQLQDFGCFNNEYIGKCGSLLFYWKNGNYGLEFHWDIDWGLRSYHWDHVIVRIE